MNCSLIRFALMSCALTIGGSAWAQARTYTTDEVNSRIWAKVSNERAKASAFKSNMSSADLERQCGSLEIGNVNTGGARFGGIREINTIVLGDVLNIPGRCK